RWQRQAAAPLKSGRFDSRQLVVRFAVPTACATPTDTAGKYMRDETDKPAGIGRRNLLTGAGLAMAATALAKVTPAKANEHETWDHETDVVCVGSGAAAAGAA